MGVVAQWQSTGGLTQGSIPGGTTFLSFPLLFQRSSDSSGPDYLSLDDLYRSSDLGEPHPLGSLCCDDAQILSKSQHTHSYIARPLIRP